MIAIEKTVYYSQFPQKEHATLSGATQENTEVGGRQRGGGTVSECLLWFPQV